MTTTTTTAAEVLALLAAKTTPAQDHEREELTRVVAGAAGASIGRGLDPRQTVLTIVLNGVLVARANGCDDSALLAIFEAAKLIESKVAAQAFEPGVAQ